MTNAFFLKHLSFTGPHKPNALLTFEKGLNVIYGASDTGKSFVLEAIDFMFGDSEELRDIPERVGYDRIFLGIETAEGEEFTLLRSTSGGAFKVFDGLHQEYPEEQEGLELALKRPPKTKKDTTKKNDNISAFLLAKLGLDQKSLRKNAQGEKETLSIRGLMRLCLINEGDIQKQSSPIESGEFVFKTKEYSLFKLLLTGVDDSALQPAEKNTAAAQSRGAKLEIIEELLVSYEKKIAESGETEEDLNEQLEKLENSLSQQKGGLLQSEQKYDALAFQRNRLRRQVETGKERKAEIQEVLARFSLLDEHYQSDLSRLEGISEAGSLIQALAAEKCPLCGASSDHQDLTSDCDGNLENVRAAAAKESEKINRLRSELSATVKQLKKEEKGFDKIIPDLETELSGFIKQINAISPELNEKRSSYTELMDERSSVRALLTVMEQIEDLKTRRDNLQKSIELTPGAEGKTSDLSSTVTYQFSRTVEAILKAWHFPDAEHVHFDESIKDLVISGKKRGSRGKGMRAITHAAFTIGLLEFCKEKSLPHAGLAVLDTPLLAYREPENSEDDLSHTDVQDKFYEYLSAWTDRQVIIIENNDPPESIRARPSSVFFTKNKQQGRYGLFPLTE